ncbi:MAG: TolC family protein [Polyangiales bacterium]
MTLPAHLRALALGAALGTTLSATSALAQAPRADRPLWSERAVIARAIEHSPDVVRARAAQYEASALATFARVPRVGNPTVGVRAMVGVPDAAAATYALIVGIPLDVSGARSHWSTEALWAAREAEARLDVARNEACSAAREAWMNAVIATESVRLADERRALALSLLEAARRRLDAQSATALDLALAEQSASDAELAVVTARREREAALSALRTLLSLDPSHELRLPTLEAPTMPAQMSRERAAALALAHRREAAALDASARRLRTSTTRLHHEATAPIFVAAEVEWQGYTQASIGASAQWSLPVALTNQGERATADAQARAADEQRAVAERQVSNEAAAAWTELELRLSELAVIERQSLPAAQRVLSLTEALFRAGTVDSYRLLRARDELFAQQQRRVDALRAAWRARIALDQSTGRSLAQ